MFENSTKLRELDLSSNHLAKEIPKEFGRLKHLLMLVLSDNQLSGSVPRELSSLSEFLYLNLSTNRLSGPIKGVHGDHLHIFYLNLNNNQFGREIPIQITKLVQLSELDLGHNSLLGLIPSQFKSLENLRVNLIKGVAHALSYMHHDCASPIVHWDISSKNVLLDSRYEASVSDFETTKFLKPDSSNWSTLAGMYGYVAPEFVYTMKVTEKFNVYSFGVFALEVIQRKHPGDLIDVILSSSTEEI
ncbi:hypothetical protein LguiB_018670 [Lonicera macranthoides]